MTNLYLSGLRKLATTNFYHHCFWLLYQCFGSEELQLTLAQDL